MTEEANQAAPVTPVTALVIMLLVIAMVVGWVLIGGQMLGVTSFFASFLFLWYWAAVEGADFKQWPQSVAGAVFGLFLAWQSVWLPAQFGDAGQVAAIIILLVSIYLQILNLVPMVINRSAMLFLTVLAAPALLDKLDAVETLKAIVLGAIFIGAVVKLAMWGSAKFQGNPAQ